MPNNTYAEVPGSNPDAVNAFFTLPTKTNKIIIIIIIIIINK